MALARTTIANMALGFIGSDTIQDIDSTSDELAVKAKFWLEPSLREMGRHHFNCLGARANLAQETSGPAFGYDYKYRQPNDCLLVRKVNGYDSHHQGTSLDTDDSARREPVWTIEGRFILTDDAECKIEYTTYVTDTSVLDGAVAAALSCLMASHMATSVRNGTVNLAMELRNLYRRELLPQALMADGNERNIPPANILSKSRFLAYRRFGTRGRVPYGS